MAREVIIRSWCDVCLHAEDGGARVDGSQYVVTLGGAQPLAVDLCETHAKELVEPLREALQALGYRPEAVAPVKRKYVRSAPPPSLDELTEKAQAGSRKGRRPLGARPWQCLWCPLDYAHTSGFRSHLRLHGFDGLTEAFGATCPVCGKTFKGQGIGAHLSRTHQDVARLLPNGSLPALFLAALRDGDRFGVVAARHAAGKDVRISLDELAALEVP